MQTLEEIQCTNAHDHITFHLQLVLPLQDCIQSNTPSGNRLAKYVDQFLRILNHSTTVQKRGCAGAAALDLVYSGVPTVSGSTSCLR